MKKKIFIVTTLTLTIILLITNNIKFTAAFDEKSCIKEEIVEINSKDLSDYVEKNNLNILSICSQGYCEQMNSKDFETSYHHYQANYHHILHNTLSEDEYLEITLKGFKIDTLEINDC